MIHTVSSPENWRLMASPICNELGLPASSIERLSVTGHEVLPSFFPVTDLAVATVGAACLAVSELIGLEGGGRPAYPLIAGYPRFGSDGRSFHWAGKCLHHGIRSQEIIGPSMGG